MVSSSKYKDPLLRGGLCEPRICGGEGGNPRSYENSAEHEMTIWQEQRLCCLLQGIFYYVKISGFPVGQVSG